MTRIDRRMNGVSRCDSRAQYARGCRVAGVITRAKQSQFSLFLSQKRRVAEETKPIKPNFGRRGHILKYGTAALRNHDFQNLKENAA